MKKKRIYESFTCDDPSGDGKRKAEALGSYIKGRSSVLSPATIRKYKSMQKNKFSDIETYKLKDVNQTVVQNFINKLSLDMSPKTVRDMNGLITAVMNRYAPDTVLKVILPRKYGRTSISRLRRK